MTENVKTWIWDCTSWSLNAGDCIETTVILKLEPRRAPPVVHLQVNCTKELQITVPIVIRRNSITLIGY